MLPDCRAWFLFLAAFNSLFLPDRLDAVDFQLILKLNTSVVCGLWISLPIKLPCVFDFKSLSGKLILTSMGLLGVNIWFCYLRYLTAALFKCFRFDLFDIILKSFLCARNYRALLILMSRSLLLFGDGSWICLDSLVVIGCLKDESLVCVWSLSRSMGMRWYKVIFLPPLLLRIMFNGPCLFNLFDITCWE